MVRSFDPIYVNGLTFLRFSGYLVIPSTFTPGLDRDFQIFVYADKPVTFTEKQ